MVSVKKGLVQFSLALFFLLILSQPAMAVVSVRTAVNKPATQKYSFPGLIQILNQNGLQTTGDNSDLFFGPDVFLKNKYNEAANNMGFIYFFVSNYCETYSAYCTRFGLKSIEENSKGLSVIQLAPPQVLKSPNGQILIGSDERYKPYGWPVLEFTSSQGKMFSCEGPAGVKYKIQNIIIQVKGKSKEQFFSDSPCLSEGENVHFCNGDVVAQPDNDTAWCTAQIGNGGCTKKLYHDVDGDDYGNPNDFIFSCEPKSGYVEDSQDCDDTNDLINPETKWYKDEDGDGFGNGDASPQTTCAPGEKFSLVADDCDDSDAAINPNASEICENDDDENCDGITKCVGELSSDQDHDNYCEGEDRDGDGDLDCVDENDQIDPTILSGDCDDANPDVHPGVAEDCSNDNVDDDCNQKADMKDPVCANGNNVDDDKDGYCDGTIACKSGAADKNKDCDDTDDKVSPGLKEDCDDGKDNNCNGKADDEDDTCSPVGSVDKDKDGKKGADDCDDTNPDIYKGAPEICNNTKDEDCDGKPDDGCNGLPTEDNDGDGFCETGVDIDGDGALECLHGNRGPGDCDDTDPLVFPSALETCGDNIDSNCNGTDEKAGSSTEPPTGGGGIGAPALSASMFANAPVLDLCVDPGVTDPPGNGFTDSGGCGCDLAGARTPNWLQLALGSLLVAAPLLLVLLLRRRIRNC